MEKVKEILEVVRTLRWYTVILLFIVIVMYSFKTEIQRVVDLRWSDKDVVIFSLENDVLIDRALKDLMVDAEADRAYIFRFHNGVTYYNGTHKSKMSNDYEIVREGISSQANYLQDIPTSLYSKLIKEVIALEFFYTDIDTMDDLRSRQVLKQQGIKAIAIAPYYRNGKLFAMIGLDYVNNQNNVQIEDFVNNTETVKEDFLNRTNQIGELLL